MKNLKLFLAGVLLVTLNVAWAQNHLDVTFRPAANFPASDLGATKLNNGGGFEAVFSYTFQQHLAAYGGWGYTIFREKESTLNIRFVETGYTFGLQWNQSLKQDSKLKFMLGAGTIYNHIETENEDGDLLYDTGHEWGWQAEAGLFIPLNERWLLVPGVRYHALTVDVGPEGFTTSSDLNYISVGMGVCWTLWKAE